MVKVGILRVALLAIKCAQNKNRYVLRLKISGNREAKMEKYVYKWVSDRTH